jgi:hypothetical protein
MESGAGVQFVDLLADIEPQQAHQIVDFVGRPFPVLRGKCEQGQMAHAQFAARLDGSSDRFGARAMAGDPRQPARARPTSVAVHDDGDMDRCGAVLGELVGGFHGSVRLA